MSEEKTHYLSEFMRQISDEMSAEYNRVQKWVTLDPGTAGDQIEENWAEILRGWLPSTYKVVTKGKIISQDSRMSPQVDVLVLKSIYPKRLLNKKLYLAAGVAAAFECKTTLRQEHIEEAVKKSVIIKDLYSVRAGTPYKELHAPIVYGLLAHSHPWTGKKATPEKNIERRLLKSDKKYVLHPRKCLDLLCVADLGTWISSKTTFVGPRVIRDYESTPYSVCGPEGAALSMHIGYTPSSAHQVEHFTPIGTLIAYLTQRLAWEDQTLRDLADYYRLTGISGSGGGDHRYWSSSIYSESVRQRAESGPLLSGLASIWNEWRLNFY